MNKISETTPHRTGNPVSVAEAWVAIFLAVTATLGLFLQPMLLGAGFSEGRITAAGIGQAATAEMFTSGVVAIAAGAFLRPIGLRYWGCCVALALGLVDLSIIGSSGTVIVINRGLAGVLEGIMLWLLNGMIARSLNPARWMAIFLTAATVAPFCLSAILPVTVMRDHGINGGFATLGLISFVAAGAALLLPRSFGPLSSSSENTSTSSVPASLLQCMAVIISVFAYQSFGGSLWAYFEPLGRQAHQSAGIIAGGISSTLAGYVGGGLAAMILANRIYHSTVVVLVGSILLAFTAILLFLSPFPVVFIASAVGYGFIIQFVMAFQVPFSIEIDPSRRVAVILPGIQMLGGSAGPILASFAVTQNNARGALRVALFCMGLSVALTLWVYIKRFAQRRYSKSAHPDRSANL